MSTAVTQKGQVTIPKRIRDLLGIGPGSRVEFRSRSDGSVTLVKTGPTEPDRFARARGVLRDGLSTDELMALTRRGDD